MVRKLPFRQLITELTQFMTFQYPSATSLLFIIVINNMTIIWTLLYSLQYFLTCPQYIVDLVPLQLTVPEICLVKLVYLLWRLVIRNS